jgi:hypothetical protein
VDVAGGEGALVAGCQRADALARGGQGAFAQRAFAPGYVHEVVNAGLEPAVSLHVYFPGLTEMTPHACTPAADGVRGLPVDAVPLR